MMTEESLQSLGWRSHFQMQVDPDCHWRAVRVVGVHRGRVDVLGEHGADSIDLSGRAAAMDIAIGDWVTVGGGTIRRRLEPFSVFRRRAAGSDARIQTIAANVDTLFVVTSANRDFNPARLERYLAIAKDAGAFPVIVITKADLVDDVDVFVADAGRLSPGMLVEALDARCSESVNALRQWCGPGQTVALLGSSGVGKSTLVNTLAGTVQATSAVRTDDQRGRHTTTSRSMHRLPDGGWLIDTPGMRELQLVDVGDALDDVFSEVSALAARCRFVDCGHESEPGCAVQAAIAAGELDPDRLRRFRKLQNEDRRNSESLAERRARDKSLGRFYRSVQSANRKRKGGE